MKDSRGLGIQSAASLCIRCHKKRSSGYAAAACATKYVPGRHCVGGEEASDDLLDPSPLLGDWLTPSQLILDLPERCPHAIAPCYPLHEELPTAIAFTDEGKTEEVDGFRLSEPTLSASICRKATELDQASLVRIERQRELLEPLAHVVPEPPGVSLVLKAHDEIVGITHDDHVARTQQDIDAKYRVSPTFSK